MGRTAAKVAVSRAVYAIDKPYDYLVPPQLEPTLRPGMRVLVPFGAGNRGAEGLVLSLGEEPEGGEARKAVLSQLDDAPVLDHLVEQLPAQVLGVLPHGEVHGQQHRRQDGGDQGHADGHEFQPELSDHDKWSPLSKKLWKMWRAVENCQPQAPAVSRQ